MNTPVPELERVKRLIRGLSAKTTENGCTEAEAMANAEKVGALLQQYDLELSDVFIGQEVCKQVEVFSDDATMFGVVTGIARLCSLRHYHAVGSSPPTYVLFGFERDVELAMYLWEVINEAQSTEWAAYSQIHGYARKKRDSFRMGFGERVRKRLIQMRRERDQAAAERAVASNSRDLVLVRDALVDEEFAKTGIRLVSGKAKKIHCGSSFYAGQDAGSRVAINTPVNGDAKSLLQ